MAAMSSVIQRSPKVYRFLVGWIECCLRGLSNLRWTNDSNKLPEDELFNHDLPFVMTLEWS
jgi:hypothetical protein